jgi:phosphoglycerate dehydrogenase-like enzyme
MRPLRGLFILDDDAHRLAYGPSELRDIHRRVDLIAPCQSYASVMDEPKLLEKVEVIFSGWGGPRLDERFLKAAPQLRAFFYAAGALSSILTDAVWERGIAVTSALAANAVPVAEYTLATALFSLKHGWQLARRSREQRSFLVNDRNSAPGAYRSSIGLISLGAVARKLIDLLRPLDLDVMVYDPFVSSAEANRQGFTLVSLEELFRCCDVVSLHAPQLSETEGMIRGELLSSMKPGATFINTARGLIVRQEELIRVATQRPDLQFVLDVATPEPPEPESALYSLPNVVLTPHIAGSCGNECRRMGRYMVEELERFVTGQPLRWAVTAQSVQHTSHRPVPPSPRSPAPKVSVIVHADLSPSLKV